MRAVLARLGAGERPALSRAQHQHALPLHGQARDPRRRPAHVEHRQRERLRQIVRHAAPRGRWRRASRGRARPAAPRPGAPPRISSSTSGVRVSDTRVAMRSPARQLTVRGVLGSDPRHAADEHPTRAGDGVLHLAPRRDDLAHPRRDARRVAGALVAELPEGGRVDVQALDVDGAARPPGRKPRVDHLRLLRQHALRPHHAAQAVRDHSWPPGARGGMRAGTGCCGA